MPAPITLEGPYYQPLRERLLRAAVWVAVTAFAVGAVSAIAMSLSI